mgnify:CR=1 FL=1
MIIYIFFFFFFNFFLKKKRTWIFSYGTFRFFFSSKKFKSKKNFKSKKHKSFVKIIDTEFAGKLAEKSALYLEKLKAQSKFELEKPENLTKSERNVLNLLLRNKNKLVTFDQIAEEIWKEKQFEKYSEYAITTIIKKIKKILDNNNSNLIIFT